MHRDAIEALAVASGVDAAVLNAYLRDPEHGASGEAAIWNARAALAEHDAHGATQLLASAAFASPSPVVLAEWARVTRATGDSHGAEVALRQAIALAELEHPGSVSIGIPEAVRERFVASPDGRRWSSYALRRIKIRDMLTGLEVAGVDLAGGGGPRGLALFNDGRVAVSEAAAVSEAESSMQNSVRIIDPSTGTSVAFAPSTESLHQLFMLAPDSASDRLAMVNEGLLVFTDARRRREGAAPAMSLLGEAGWPSALSWRGDFVLGHFWSTEVRVWDAADRQHPAVITWPKGNAASAISQDGTRLALAGESKIALYEPRGGNALGDVHVPPGASIDNLVFVGNTLYAADTARGDLYRADGNAMVSLARGLPLVGPLSGDHWVPLGASTRVLAASGAIIELAPRNGVPRVIRRIAPGSSIEGLGWSLSGRLAVAAGGALSFLDPSGVRGTQERVAQGILQGSLHNLHNLLGTGLVWWVTPSGFATWKDNAVTVVPFGNSPTRARTNPTTKDDDLARWGLDIMESVRNNPSHGIVTLAELRSSAKLYQHLHPEQWPDRPCIAMSEDASTIVIHPSAGEIQIWHRNEASPMRLAVPDGVQRLAIVDHGRRLVRSTPSQTLVFNLKRGVVEREIAGDLAAISEDGHWLVSENRSEYHLHDLHRNRDLGPLKVGGVDAVMFDPAGTRLAVGTYDGTVAVLEAPLWNVVAKWAAHDSSVDAIAWRPDGALLATGGEGGVLRIWKPNGEAVTEIALGEMLPPGNGEPDPDWIAVFPDGTATGTDLGREHIALRVGATPLGLGVSVPPPAPASYWAALFSAPATPPPGP